MQLYVAIIMKSRKDAIREIINRHEDNAVYITNTGYISRAVYNEYPNNKNIFYMQGSMGMAPCIGLGIAMNSDKEIVVLNGDAALLMHLGITHTIRDENLKNLYIYVLDNGCHESVGKYKCSYLEDFYSGITEIIKISNDGKTDRVELSCIKNTNQIKELF
jgi:thiamine pyrophosphate-dependent acetolactate synthase large subunit-like protein